MKNTTDRSRWKMVWRAALCAVAPWTLGACDSAPDHIELSNGTWMLDQATRTRDGLLIPCRPMLMALEITDESVYLSSRAYPCEDERIISRALTMQREGTSLLLDDVQVGTLLARRMDIVLPSNDSISWNLDRPDAPWQELVHANSMTTLYQAQPALRPDSRPVPMITEYAAQEDRDISGRLHAATFATDAEEGLEYLIQKDPKHGYVWALNSQTGTFIYTPDPNFVGRDEFRFCAKSLNIFTEAAPIGLTFSPVPDGPFANDSTIVVKEDSSVSFKPNMGDPDGDVVTLEVVAKPEHGNLVDDGGTFTYTPESEFSGVDSFMYRVSDGTQWSKPATLQISVLVVNDPPTVDDVELVVTAGSATPLNLQINDVDTQVFSLVSQTPPKLGTLRGSLPYFVYEPDPLVTQGEDSFELTISDGSGVLATAHIKVIITPGAHKCALLGHDTPMDDVYPMASEGAYIYFRSSIPFIPVPLGITDGTATFTTSLWINSFDTLGFDNNIGNVRRTAFFRLPPTTFFTTSQMNWHMRLYSENDSTGLAWFDIPKPSNDVSGEPSIGDAYTNGNGAYFPLQWPTGSQGNVCQVWKIDALTQVPESLHDFSAGQANCLGIWGLAGEMYMFVGSKLMRVPMDASPPILIKDLGSAIPTPWMVEVGGKSFFQTRTAMGNETRIDLWVTDGTDAGTKNLKTLETSILEFDIFSPVAFGNKLYFAHRKSLWSSDGTVAGTSIVATMDVSSLIGNGAIGTITPIQDKLVFLASTDAAGREPWVSDGTAVGTKILRDIRVGPLGSATASTNPTYFHSWNGQVFFTADDGGPQTGLWSTDGTSGGTISRLVRPMKTILGTLGNNLVFFDGHQMYSADLL